MNSDSRLSTNTKATLTQNRMSSVKKEVVNSKTGNLRVRTFNELKASKGKDSNEKVGLDLDEQQEQREYKKAMEHDIK